MKLKLLFDDQPVTVNFNPREVSWKSQNYGQYSHHGFRFPKVAAPVFIKRHKDIPESCDLICTLMEQGSPATSLPSIYGFFEVEGADDGFTCYIFMEMLLGAPLLEKIRKVKIDDCHEILQSVFFSLEAILENRHWYPDLDFRNIMFHKRSGTSQSWLIDIDSCLPDAVTFADFLRDRGGDHTNVNERYWGCVVPMAMERGTFDDLSGKAVTQAAFVYFVLDLFFKVSYPDNPIHLKPDNIFKLMEGPSPYMDVYTQEIWRAIHEELAGNPEDGCGWEVLDDFVVSLFGFDQPLNPREDGFGGLNAAFRRMGRWFSSFF